jgi:hypothetical protein
MVRTGAYAYVKYGYESSFAGSATVNKSFGVKTAVTSLTLGTNRQSLYKLGQVEADKYAYGQQTGSLSLDFVLGDVTSGDVFKAIYGAPTGQGTGASNHVYGSDTGSGSSKTFVGQTFTTELGFSGETDIMVRSFKGCILNTLGVTAAVGDVVKCTGDVVYGKEDNPSTSTTTAATEASQPFTFAHGALTLNGVVQTQIQEVDINFAQNGDLLYQVGSNQAVAGIKKTLDITGRFKVAWKDNTALETVIAQLAGANYKETWADKNGANTPEIELHFTNGVVGNGERKITIIGKGLGLTDHSVSGLEPIEAVFEELNLSIKSAKIVVVNSE